MKKYACALVVFAIALTFFGCGVAFQNNKAKLLETATEADFGPPRGFKPLDDQEQIIRRHGLSPDRP